MQPTDPTKRDPNPGVSRFSADRARSILLTGISLPSHSSSLVRSPSVSSGPRTAMWLKPYTTFGQNLNIEGPGSFFCSKIPKEPGMELGED